MKFKKLAAAALAAVSLVLAMAVPVSADSIFDTAKNIDSGKKVTKTLKKSESMDYKITPTKKGTATVKITSKTNNFDFFVYNEDGEDVVFEEKATKGWGSGGSHYWDSNAGCYIGTLSFDVKANKTYYIKIRRGSYSNGGSGKIEASFKYPSEPVEETALMSVTLKKRDTLQLGANGSGAKWSTSQKSVATVSGSGLVKAVKKGKAVITLKCGSKSQKIEIVVT